MQFTRNTSSTKKVYSLILKFGIIISLFFLAVFLLSKVDLPAPKKTIEKIIPNENFKIVK